MFNYSYCNVYMHIHLPTTCLPDFCVSYGYFSYGYLQALVCLFTFFVKGLQGFEDHIKFFPPPLPEVLNKYCISGNIHCQLISL